MKDEQLLTEEEKFWGPRYGSIYPALEGTDPYKDLISEFENFVEPRPGQKWLDAGTGSGAMVDMLWRKTNGNIGEIIALDLTEVMLDHLKSKMKKMSPVPNENQIKPVKHNLSNKLKFEDAYFDGIVTNLVLPYIETHEGRSGEDALRAILEDMNRVLKSGGQFAWSSPKNGVKFYKVFLASWKEILNPKKIKNLYYGPAILRYAQKIQKKGEMGEYNFLPEEGIKKIVQESGFCEPEISYSFAGQAIIVKTNKK